MSYLALYRKYRPQRFEDIVGQEHITKTLINQIKTGRVGHAYLFCGSRGTGKTTTARVFARAINCLNPQNGSPCGECEVCKALKQGEQFDIVEIDAASNNGVDDARSLREQVKFLPVVGKKKVFIIDEVHMLSTSAFNALLKTLEEPPEHVVFIFGTTEIQKLPATILSRLMRFDFHLLSVEQIEEVLKKILNEDNIAYDEAAVNMVARQGEGSMRDAISLLDSCLSYSPSKLTTDAVVSVLGTVGREEVVALAKSIASGDVKQMITSVDNLLIGGKSPLVVSRELLSLIRDLLIVDALGDGAKQMCQVDSQGFELMQNAAKEIGRAKLLKMVTGFGDIESELRLSVHPRLVLEMALFKVVGELQPLPQFKAEATKPTTAPELDRVVSILKKPETNYLGQLLLFVRKRGNMELLSAISELENISEKGGCLSVECSPETKDLMEANRGLINEFLTTNNLKDVKYSVKNATKFDIFAMKKFFGAAFSVEE